MQSLHTSHFIGIGRHGTLCKYDYVPTITWIKHCIVMFHDSYKIIMDLFRD
jgi:hypothetical protein